VATTGWSDAAENVGQGSLGEAEALDGLVVTGGCALNIKVNQVRR
jgi:predicted NodU family carbamoyl transferase